MFTGLADIKGLLRIGQFSVRATRSFPQNRISVPVSRSSSDGAVQGPHDSDAPKVSLSVYSFRCK